MDRKLDELLYFLSQNMMVAVSGEKLAQDFDVSHSTIQNWIQHLRNSGVEIRGELFAGFRIERVPDIVLAHWLRPRLRTEALGRNYHHYYELDSTNAEAQRMIASGAKAPTGTLILAETQNAGRGRMGRTWHSAPGAGLYFSLILRPEIPANLTPLLTLGAAVSMHNAIERRTRLSVDIKWPNDLLIGRRKICGILAEIHAEVDRVRTMVIGLGVNVNQEEFPADIQERATSLRREAGGQRQSRIEILADFLADFETLLQRFQQDGPRAIIDPWLRFSSFAEGRQIEVDDGFRQIRGITRGLNTVGALRVEQDDGRIEEVYSGDVMRWA